MERESPTVPGRVWFFQGAVVGLLLTGTLNALSYFVRSGGWGSLLGGSAVEAMGFPMQLWAGDGYHVHSISTVAFIVNLGFMLGLSAVCGLVTTWFAAPLNRLVGSFEMGADEKYRLQFSLKGLLLLTLFASVASAVVGQFSWSPRVLAGIYLLGPLCLVVVAMVPRGIHWQQRVAIVMPGSIALIAVALFIGFAVEVTADKVLLGIFTCWTPQSALAAIAITAGLLFHYRAHMMPEQTPVAGVERRA